MYSEIFTPYNYYPGLFEDRYEKALRDTEKQGRPAPNYNFVVPINELEAVKSRNQGLDLNISYAENMRNRAEQIKEFEKAPPPPNPDENILNLLQTQEANIQTPPLPPQPTPVTPQTVANVVPQTGLTATETALLSPEEQAIRLKQKGIA
tara:strand:- start:65 stop:514 length:450 start_codon:yes stop_codon:yes gene_type:complete